MLKTFVRIVCAISLLLPSSPAFADDTIAACVRSAEDAQSQRSAHQFRAARQRFLACAQESCPLVVRNDCTGWLAELDNLMPSIVVQARDTKGVELTDVRVLMDGEVLAYRLDGLAIGVDPGVHLFQFERVGVPALQQQILIREGEKGRALPITLAAAPPPPDLRARYSPHPSKLTYLFGGIAIGGLAGFTYFGLKGTADAHRVGASACGKTQTCPEDEIVPIKRELAVGDISLGIGLLSLGAAAYFFFTERQAPAQAASGVHADVVLAPGVGRVTVSTPF